MPIWGSNLPSSSVTPEQDYLNRRLWLKQMGLAGMASLAPDAFAGNSNPYGALQFKSFASSAPGPLTSEKDATRYNNFYEFGTDKEDPSSLASRLKPHPWQLKISGLVKNPRSVNLEDVFKKMEMEERIYRFRCVEAWAMVVPWVGFPLAKLVDFCEPLGSAKYIQFKTLFDPVQFPGQKGTSIDWPYVEALRMDEARHPLALMTVGMYGKWLPNQNGAPIRLVIPWKYGFKSIKSIVEIVFSETQPKTSWTQLAPQEYGFYANVNPTVDHPRWSQAKERVLGKFGKQKTLLFNGYANEVGSLYSGLDLIKNF